MSKPRFNRNRCDVLGIYVEYGIEVLKDNKWTFYNDDPEIYEDDGIFESYLGTVFATELMKHIPKKDLDNISEDAMKHLTLNDISDVEYYVTYIDRDDYCDLPRNILRNLGITKMEYLKNINNEKVRLIVVFN